MNRRQFVGAPAAAVLAQPARRDYRNVLLLIADDHSPLAGCYGNPVVQTPHMDRLARQGVRFSQAYCTTASCSASRSVVLTGLQNHANGQFGHAHMPHNFHTHPAVQSIPRLARAHGVETGVIGKLHVNPPAVYPWSFESPGGSKGGTRDVHGMAQEAERFFRQIDGRPFYLHVGFGDPHRSGGGQGFANDRAYPNVKKNVYSPADVIVPPFLPDRPEVRRELAEYYQSIDRLDQGVGFLLEALEKSGRAKDTLVIYMSDHGMPFPGAKGSFYDSGLQCPLIVSTPEMKRRGVVNQALVHWPDIAPTVLDWMRVPGPDYSMHGRSLVTILEQEQPPERDEFFFSHTFHEINNYYPMRGIRTRRHKYVRFLYPELEMPLPSDLFASPTWQGIRERRDPAMGQRRTEAVMHHAREELYDLEKDPQETTNLGATQTAVLAELRDKVRQMRRQTRDPWFIENQGLG
ncbi:MAG: sulfatase [Acidobacteria bacterium]|nr:sulfatase [Acidobacteriota bacterium]